jgi:hypothetical protein
MHRHVVVTCGAGDSFAGVSGMKPTVIRIGEPRELLAYVPYSLGFVPRDSLVVISLRGGRGRIGLVARADVGDLFRDSSGAALAASLAHHLEADGADRVVLVLYTDSPRSEVRSGRGPAGTALARMAAALPEEVIRDAWIVGPSGYSSVGCEDEACCPAGGRPLAELESTQVSAHMVLSGNLVAGCREDLRVHRRAPAPARRSAARAAGAERIRRREVVRRAQEEDEPAPLRQWAERALARWSDLRERAALGRELPSTDLGRQLAALEHAALRDAMMLCLAMEIDPRAADVESALDAVFSLGGSPPDSVRLTHAREVLEATVAHVPQRRAAPALAFLAWLAWWEGDGARAGVLVDQALEADPGYRLGLLLDDVLGAGIPPSWVRSNDEPGREVDRSIAVG